MELPAFKRHRRLRGSAAIRGLVRETELTPSHLVYPLFIEAGLHGRSPIASMPGHRAVLLLLSLYPVKRRVDG